MGTAGSATLVLQTVLPALLTACGPSELILEGGTHNPWAPPFEFLARAFLPLVNRMGPKVQARLERHGFYPAGSGRLRVSIVPAPALAGFDLLDRGRVLSQQGLAAVANLPRHIAQRERDVVLAELDWAPRSVEVAEVEAQGPGSFVCLIIESEHVTEVFSSFGRRGVRAERVAHEVVGQVREYLDCDAPVGPHLADQLMLPLGLSAAMNPADGQRGGRFRTLPLRGHAQTHLELLPKFLDLAVGVDSADDGRTCVVSPAPQALQPHA